MYTEYKDFTYLLHKRYLVAIEELDADAPLWGSLLFFALGWTANVRERERPIE